MNPRNVSNKPSPTFLNILTFRTFRISHIRNISRITSSCPTSSSTRIKGRRPENQPPGPQHRYQRRELLPQASPQHPLPPHPGRSPKPTARRGPPAATTTALPSSNPRAFAVPVRYYEPAKKQCGFHCGNARIAGSSYCRQDTCRSEDCVRPARAWGGYCEDHGKKAPQKATNCRGKPGGNPSADDGVDAAAAAAETPIVSKDRVIARFCKVHMCKIWGCGKQGKKELTGYCADHFEDMYSYC
ncbi:unnamed protein product [Parascedosporium putredinis]|uniref:SRCR domain-containing protein n=1 Tax=Parascedosporium putredinis TaxID=1442378 RepID=A0A9P1H8V4_9PEZI|nr:unnamed protein product [Parascedosporium putredinis]CAI8001096.1 unnamed protein product [Parascedosporium putredinis]